MFPLTGPRPAVYRLTRQQARTLAAVAITPSRRDAADLLALSAHTVRRHLSLAFEALDASSLSEALWRAGWTLPPLDLLDLPARAADGMVWITGVE